VLARQAEDPEVAALLSDGRRLQARLQARYADLRELAQGLTEAEQRSTWIDVLEVAEGCGLARVETARGTLLHRVELDGDRVARYAIVAPTEWNFHPQGAFGPRDDRSSGRDARRSCAGGASAGLGARSLRAFAVTVKDA
jgi:Ni,Fe-hydrogenase I large subunit